MKICAIICEYNPFHNGHKFHIQESLKQSGCDAVLCIMGGNFSQRGEPTLVEKYTRAEMAIAGGASAVVQIPTYFCTGTAEIFAQAAIKIATSFKNVTHISFGSECGDIRSLTELAKFLNKEPEFYKSRIKRNLNDG
ncbi:MAG: nucleotidyltransferase family protein, partial [Clostridia bacterium]|nr:nucleotidyltransferase family protein [Clostridia bacterium]